MQSGSVQVVFYPCLQSQVHLDPIFGPQALVLPNVSLLDHCRRFYVIAPQASVRHTARKSPLLVYLWLYLVLSIHRKNKELCAVILNMWVVTPLEYQMIL